MDLERSDDYEAPALQWLYREARRLNDALLEGGVADDQQRRAILTSFVFGFSVGFGEPVESRGTQWEAELALRHDQRTLLPTELFDFHDYALAVVDEVFGG